MAFATGEIINRFAKPRLRTLGRNVEVKSDYQSALEEGRNIVSPMVIAAAGDLFGEKLQGMGAGRKEAVNEARQGIARMFAVGLVGEELLRYAAQPYRTRLSLTNIELAERTRTLLGNVGFDAMGMAEEAEAGVEGLILQPIDGNFTGNPRAIYERAYGANSSGFDKALGLPVACAAEVTERTLTTVFEMAGERINEFRKDETRLGEINELDVLTHYAARGAAEQNRTLDRQELMEAAFEEIVKRVEGIIFNSPKYANNSRQTAQVKQLSEACAETYATFRLGFPEVMKRWLGVDGPGNDNQFSPDRRRAYLSLALLSLVLVSCAAPLLPTADNNNPDIENDPDAERVRDPDLDHLLIDDFQVNLRQGEVRMGVVEQAVENALGENIEMVNFSDSNRWAAYTDGERAIHYGLMVYQEEDGKSDSILGACVTENGNREAECKFYDVESTEQSVAFKGPAWGRDDGIAGDEYQILVIPELTFNKGEKRFELSGGNDSLQLTFQSIDNGVLLDSLVGAKIINGLDSGGSEEIELNNDGDGVEEPLKDWFRDLFVNSAYAKDLVATATPGVEVIQVGDSERPQVLPTPTEAPAQFVADGDVIRMWNPDTGVYDRDLAVPESVVLKHKGEWNAETGEWSVEPARLDENGRPVFENPIYRTTLSEGGEWETEYLRSTCLDSELLQWGDNDFLKRTGKTVEQALREYEQSDEYDPFISWSGLTEGVNFLSSGRKYMVVSAVDINTNYFLGASDDTYVSCLIVAHPDAPDLRISFVAGYGYGNRWVPSTAVSVMSEDHLDGIGIKSNEDFKLWVNDFSGRGAIIMTIINFTDPRDLTNMWVQDPCTDPDNSFKTLISRLSEDAYFKRFTLDSSELGPISPMDDRQHPNPLRVVGLLDLEVDVGLLPNGIYIPENYSFSK